MTQEEPVLSPTMPTTGKRKPRRRQISAATLLLLLVLVSCALGQAYRGSLHATGIDFYQFWAVGKALSLHETSDIYSARGRAQLGTRSFTESQRASSSLQRTVAAQRIVFDTTATPFLYAVFGIFSTDDYATDLQRHRALLLACFVFGVAGMALRLGLGTTNALLATATLCTSFEPLFSDLRVGNVGCLQLAGVVLYVLLRHEAAATGRIAVAGCLMGLLVAFKPNLVFVAWLMPYLSLRKGDHRSLLRELLGMALGGTLAVAGTALHVGGIRIWLDWVAAIRNVPDQSITAEFGNYSPLMAMRHLSPKFAPLLLAVALAVAAGVGLWIRRGQSVTADAAEDEASVSLWWMAVGCLCVVLLPILAWLHYFVLVVPAMLFVLRHLAGKVAQPPSDLGSLAPSSWLPWGMIGHHVLGFGAWLGLCINPFELARISYSNAKYGLLVIAALYLLFAAVFSAKPKRSPVR